MSSFRAVGKSMLPLPTEGEVYDRIRCRSLDKEDIGVMDTIIDYTLIECRKGTKLLLGYKKRGFGIGKWNGFGGKFDPGETAVECARRELYEECGIDALSLNWRATLFFTFQDSGKLMRVHVFETRDFKGEPRETEEMAPKWFEDSELPLEHMWHDDSFWLPLFLQGSTTFTAHFDYAPGGEAVNKVLNHKFYFLSDEHDASTDASFSSSSSLPESIHE